MRNRNIDVHLHTNNTCNLKCLHCYNRSGEGLPRFLPTDLEINLSHFLCQNFTPNIHLEGGEIFLHKESIAVLAHCSREELEHITITTNGSVLTEDEEILKVLRNIALLRVSVEGHTDTLNEAVRGIPAEKVLQNAQLYKEMKVEVALRLTLNALNVNQMISEVIPALTERGFDRIQIYEHQPVGRGRASNLDVRGTLHPFFEELVRSEIGMNTIIMLPRRRGEEIHHFEKRLTDHGATIKSMEPALSLSIGADGSVHACPWITDSPPLMYIDNDRDSFMDAINRIPPTHSCDFCSAYSISWGGSV